MGVVRAHNVALGPSLIQQSIDSASIIFVACAHPSSGAGQVDSIVAK